jgi:hypothetical protein
LARSISILSSQLNGIARNVSSFSSPSSSLICSGPRYHGKVPFRIDSDESACKVPIKPTFKASRGSSPFPDTMICRSVFGFPFGGRLANLPQVRRMPEKHRPGWVQWPGGCGKTERHHVMTFRTGDKRRLL